MRAALLAAGVTTFLVLLWLLSRGGGPDVLLTTGDVQPGEVVLVTVSLDVLVRAPEDLGGRVTRTPIDAVFITRDLDGEWYGLLTTSPWRGCRLEVVGAPDDRVRFADPCHGGRYGIDGAIVDGPGTRGITDVPLVVTDRGVDIDTDRLG